MRAFPGEAGGQAERLEPIGTGEAKPERGGRRAAFLVSVWREGGVVHGRAGQRRPVGSPVLVWRK